MKHRKDKKEKSAERKRDRKKHKRHHDSDGSSSEGEVQAEVPPRPWHRMRVDRQGERDRKNPKWAKKFLVMRKLTDMVMGDPNFLPNPCAILCPFDGPRCTHGFFRMNGSCKPSQLFSHWQHMHANNPAAKQLEARWRQAIKMKGTSRSSSSTSAPRAR